MKTNDLMNIIFLAMAIIAMIPLTIAVFTTMNVTMIRISAIIVFIGILGNFICVLIRTWSVTK